MIFPYLRGMVFCVKLTNEGGWKAIDEAYKNPPVSTEQILHPEKYLEQARLAHDDRPGRAEAGTPAGKKSGGTSWARCRSAVMLGRQGAQGRRRLGRRPLRGLRRAATASSAWSGSPPGTARTTPASSPGPTPATRPEAHGQEGASSPSRFPTRSGGATDDVCQVVERRGADVAVIEGFPPAATAALLEAAFHARKTEFSPQRSNPSGPQTRRASETPVDWSHPKTILRGTGAMKRSVRDGLCLALLSAVLWLGILAMPGSRPGSVSGSARHLESATKDQTGQKQGCHDQDQGARARLQDQRGVAEAVDLRAVHGHPDEGHRAGLLRQVCSRPLQRDVPLRLLRGQAVRLQAQVRLGHRLAQLLAAGLHGARSRPPGTTAIPPRSASRSRAAAAAPTSGTSSRTARAHGPALLHQFALHPARFGEINPDCDPIDHEEGPAYPADEISRKAAPPRKASPPSKLRSRRGEVKCCSPEIVPSVRLTSSADPTCALDPPDQVTGVAGRVGLEFERVMAFGILDDLAVGRGQR